MKPSKTGLLRIDDKEFSNLINDCIDIKEDKNDWFKKVCEIATEYEHNSYIDIIIDIVYGFVISTLSDDGEQLMFPL